MAISRAQLLKELEPGLNAIFGDEYSQYENEDAPLFTTEKSNRAFEEEVLFPGFGAAAVKPEGQGVQYATTGEGWVARYTHETVALAFAITEEAVEDNLYDKLSSRLSKMLARSMAHTRQVKAANVYNNGFSTSFLGGDGDALCSTSHTLQKTGSDLANRLNPDADLSETALEAAIVEIAGWTDDAGIPTSLQVKSLHIPRNSVFIAERILKSPYRVDTANNDVNAIYNMGAVPGGYYVNHRFTDTDAWFLRTDAPNGMKHFVRKPISTKMEGDFETGNVRFKARERYVYGWSDWRGVYGSQGA
jgi:hypothetical protein